MAIEKKDMPPEDDRSPDYYWENGFVVFTAKFLRKRGTCCESGCRHCPYGFKKTDSNGDKLK